MFIISSKSVHSCHTLQTLIRIISIRDLTQFFQSLSPQSVLKAQLNGGNNCKTVSALSRILEDQSRASILEHKQEQERREQERQQQEIQRIILAQAAANCQSMGESFSGTLEHDDSNGSPELDDTGVLDANASGDLNGGLDIDAADSSDGGSGLGPSDEQVRASMIHLLNPVLGSAFGSSIIEEVSSGKRKGEEGASSGSSKKHRWMTVDELEESRFGRSKSYGRVHCKATYKCAVSNFFFFTFPYNDCVVKTVYPG
ncbi:unnamed protein product [Cylicostephanus goldi]|uniref:Uncharacterized protein n=1 Tax=Cylicostephanus goldi TaxID=71465 RepID=A0A3P6QD64_CYLGO|nr:unnamed protein product [Cylicostephanus goldi]